MTLNKALRSFLVLISAVAYIGFIIHIGQVSVNSGNWEMEKDSSGKIVEKKDADGNRIPADPPAIPEPITIFLGIMGAALAVHTGAVLGIEMKGTGAQGAQQRIQQRRASSFLYTRLYNAGAAGLRGLLSKAVELLTGRVPDFAAVVYVVGVLIAVCYYLFGEGFEEAAVPFLRSSWTVLVGLFAGIWAAGGPNTVPVPDLVIDANTNITKDRASEMLDAFGLKPKWDPGSAPDHYIVTDQYPEAYTRVEPGSEVKVTLSQP